MRRTTKTTAQKIATPAAPTAPAPKPTAGSELFSAASLMVKAATQWLAKMEKGVDRYKAAVAAGRVTYAASYLMDAMTAEEALDDFRAYAALAAAVTFRITDRAPVAGSGEVAFEDFAAALAKRLREVERRLLEGTTGRPNSTCPVSNIGNLCKQAALVEVRKIASELAWCAARIDAMGKLPAGAEVEYDHAPYVGY